MFVASKPRKNPGPARPPGETRAAVAELYEQGRSMTEIARVLGVSKPTVCFHLRMLGVPPKEDFARRHDWDDIRRYYEAGNSMTACLKRFGCSRHAWWDAIRRGVIKPRPRGEPIEDILAAGRRRNRNHVKLRLLDAGLKDRRCEQCGLAEWQGCPLSLELHHVNGDGLENRLENLLLLCPNCHSQTDTWGGRGQKRKKVGVITMPPVVDRCNGANPYGSANSAGSFVNPALTAAI
jgi:transposase-like protein